MALAALIALALAFAEPADSAAPIATSAAARTRVEAERLKAAADRAAAERTIAERKAAEAEAAKPKTPPTPAELAQLEPLPAGAPEDDYGFVAWCYGSLRGHMSLFTVVSPDLNSLPDADAKTTAAADAEMMQAGQQYLNLYNAALNAADIANGDRPPPPPPPLPGHGKAPPPPKAPPWPKRRAEIVKTSLAKWTQVREADAKTRMWSWVMWVLPGRCEYAAERLYETSNLAGQAKGINMRSEPLEKPKMPRNRQSGESVAPLVDTTSAVPR